MREVTSHACSNAGERALHEVLFPVEWFLQTFARLSCNSFSVSDDELRPVGSALMPSVAMLNHSCRPSCVAVFSFGGAGGGRSGAGTGGVVARIRTPRPIAAGEKLSISYIGLVQSRSFVVLLHQPLRGVRGCRRLGAVQR